MGNKMISSMKFNGKYALQNNNYLPETDPASDIARDGIIALLYLNLKLRNYISSC